MTGWVNHHSQVSKGFIPAELLASDGFLRRGSHCCWCSTHYGTHQAPMESSKLMVTLITLTRLNGTQSKTKRQDISTGKIFTWTVDSNREVY